MINLKKKIFLGSAVIVLIDQIIKLLIINNLKVNESLTIINNLFYLSYVQNEGSAWNILYVSQWFFIILSLLAIYTIIRYFLLDVNITKIEAFAYASILGGIIGNLIDRFIHGYIIDYIDILIGSYHYPIFNLADSFIVIGVVIIIWTLLKGNKK